MRKFKFFLNIVCVLMCTEANALGGFPTIEIIDGILYSLNHETYTAEVLRLEGYEDWQTGKVCPPYSGDITIPSTLRDGYSVISISEKAFWNCVNVTSVNIPNSVKYIGHWAFAGCISLTSITIPNSVTSIGEAAFAGCTGLTSITIPNSVTSIGSYAFSRCSSITSLFIPKSVTSLGDIPFGSCSSLSSIVVEEGNSVYDSRNNCNAIISTESNYLLVGCKNTIIPNDVTVIGTGAFEGCTGLTEIDIHNDVETIGYGSFWGCTGLTTINIPSSVTIIGNVAFQNCSNLVSLTINGITSICYQAFYGCSRLKDVYCNSEKAPSASSCFSSEDVKQTTLHVKDYAVETFKGVIPWAYFKEIVCDENKTDFKLVYEIDGVEYKTELHKYNDVITPLAKPQKKGMTFSGWNNLPEKMPGKDVKVTGTFSWSKQTKDKIVYEVADTLNNYCRIIGNDKASGLLAIPTSVDIDRFRYSVVSISEDAFNSNASITEIIIPETITDICFSAFYGCNGITSVRFHCKEIGSWLEYIKSNIVEVEIGQEVEKIGDKAFYCCTGITSLVIPNNVNTIGENAFGRCKNTETIEIGNDIKTIGERAFANIDKLTNVTCWAEEVPTTDRTAFENSYIEDYVTLHVPYDAIGKYRAIAPWKNFKIIVPIEGTEPTTPKEKCEAPTIEYKNGKLSVGSSTNGTDCVTTITCEDIDTFNGGEIAITATYNISSYAKADGYNDSEMAYATLCWIEKDESTTGINEKIESNAVLIQSHEGVLWITGVDYGTDIKVYDMVGKELAKTIASVGTTMINTGLKAGDIALVKIKNKTIKIVVR